MTSLSSLIFLAGALALFYTYVGYPMILALFARRSNLSRVEHDDYLPTVSVLISARNEEKDIGWKVAETLAWDYPASALEVLVASDASDDTTDSIVDAIQDPRVQLVRMESRGGKGRALNRLVELARGEVLFFTDANAHIGSGCLRKMIRHLADEHVGCVTGGSVSTEENNQTAIEGGTGAYLGYESLITRLENRLGSVLACDGAIFCMRRKLYTPVLPELANDLELPLRVRHAGYLVLYEPQAFVTERGTESVAEEFARRRRIAAQGGLALWKLRGILIGTAGWQLFSHKLFRYLTPVWLLLLLVGSIGLAGNPLFSAILILQVIFYLMALAGLGSVCLRKSTGKLLAIPFYVVFGSIGSFAGILDACSGRRFDIWEIPTLSRGAGRATPLNSR